MPPHEVTFKPDHEIFTNSNTTTTSRQSLRELSFLNSGLQVNLVD